MKPEVLGFEQNAIDTDVISFHFKPSGCRKKLSSLESNYHYVKQVWKQFNFSVFVATVTITKAIYQWNAGAQLDQN